MAATKSLNFLRPITDPKNAQLDIVAVHGLNIENREDHAQSTWTASNEKMWLKDFLPEQLPDARILLFGYNSNVGAGASIAGIDEQAGNLLNRLGGKRKEADQRPIIFICHSLGGIIVKKALVMAMLDETYGSIQKSCYGVVFFGTPHRGGNVASLGSIAASIARKNQSNTFLEALKKDGLFADNISSEFRHQLENYQVVTIYETLPPSRIVVDQKSATLGLSGKRERQIAMDADHENICKFQAIDGDDYQQVADNIIEMAENAIKDASAQCKTYVLNPRMMQDLRLSDPEDDKFDLTRKKGKRLGNTCQWILEEPEFDDWASMDKGSGILWIHGKPGIGKTMISEFLVEALRSKSGSSLVYFFCDQKDVQRNSVDAILRGFLWQLLNQIPGLSDHIEHSHNQGGRVVFERTGSLGKFFSRIVRDKRVGDVYWVIDGFDECTESSRRTFLELLASEFTSITGRVKVIIVSRPLNQIREDLGRFLAVNTICVESSKNNDINDYIDYQCEKLVKTQKYRETRANEVKETLKKGSDKMFLWVSLVVGELRRCAADDTEKTLRGLPKDLDGVYELILSHTPEEALQTVVSILTWIAMAARPLTRGELAAARAKFGSANRVVDELDADLRLCERLITSKGEKIHLIHQSVKDYLLKPDAIPGRLLLYASVAEKTHSELAEVCLLFLMEEVGDEYPRDFKNNGFLEYSISYWPHHLRELGSYPASGSLRLALDDFLSEALSHPHFEKWLRHDWSSRDTQGGYNIQNRYDAQDRYLRETTLLHFASYVGICPLIRHVFTRLSWARKLEWKLSVRSDVSKWTSLHSAALNGHSDAIKLLLNYGVNVHRKTHDAGMTALHLAACEGHLQVLENLLNGKAKIDAEDNKLHTALYWTAVYGHNECTKLLVGYGADERQRIKGETLGRQSIISWAVRTGREDVIKRMLDDGAYLNPNLLHLAAKNRGENVVRLLLEKGAEVNWKDGGRQTALHAAALSGSEAVAKVLLEKGAEINLKDGRGRTALHLAAYRGSEAVAKVLLEKGVEINLKDEVGRTALHLAAGEGSEAVAKVLLEKGAEINLKDEVGRTALHLAARWVSEAVAKVLLEKGVEINLKDEAGQTALHLAASSRSEAVVKALLEKGVEINLKDEVGQTALHLAACWRSEAVVKVLLEKGTEINAEDMKGQTALDIATRQGEKVIVKLLVKGGARYGGSKPHRRRLRW